VKHSPRHESMEIKAEESFLGGGGECCSTDFCVSLPGPAGLPSMRQLSSAL
jgi:hypothetical protein